MTLPLPIALGSCCACVGGGSDGPGGCGLALAEDAAVVVEALLEDHDAGECSVLTAGKVGMNRGSAIGGGCVTTGTVP